LNNPQYLLTVTEKTKLDALLLQQEEEDFDPISFYLIKTEGVTQKLITVKNDDIIVKGKFASPTDCKYKLTFEFPLSQFKKVSLFYPNLALGFDSASTDLFRWR
jgi:hypothetical protein